MPQRNQAQEGDFPLMDQNPDTHCDCGCEHEQHASTNTRPEPKNRDIVVDLGIPYVIFYGSHDAEGDISTVEMRCSVNDTLIGAYEVRGYPDGLTIENRMSDYDGPEINRHRLSMLLHMMHNVMGERERGDEAGSTVPNVQMISVEDARSFFDAARSNKSETLADEIVREIAASTKPSNDDIVNDLKQRIQEALGPDAKVTFMGSRSRDGDDPNAPFNFGEFMKTQRAKRGSANENPSEAA
jgi:hypothetical protein